MANVLANAMLTLDRHPSVRRELLAESALLPSAVEELLRFEPPVHELGRTLTRDAAHFDRPDVLDVRRDPNPHLSFGFGVHFCLGASLARLEARVALEEVLGAIPDYRVTTSEIRWSRTPSVRGPAALPIAFTPRTSRD